MAIPLGRKTTASDIEERTWRITLDSPKGEAYRFKAHRENCETAEDGTFETKNLGVTVERQLPQITAKTYTATVDGQTHAATGAVIAALLSAAVDAERLVDIKLEEERRTAVASPIPAGPGSGK